MGVRSFPKVASSYGSTQAVTFSFCSTLKEGDFKGPKAGLETTTPGICRQGPCSPGYNNERASFPSAQMLQLTMMVRVALPKTAI